MRSACQGHLATENTHCAINNPKILNSISFAFVRIIVTELALQAVAGPLIVIVCCGALLNKPATSQLREMRQMLVP